MIPRIRLTGKPFERGQSYGRQASPRIQHSLAAYRDIFERRAGLSWPAALGHARRFRPAIDDFAPEALEEMRGIADGAAIDFDSVLALNCRSELMFAAAKSRGELPPGECTSFAATAAVTDDGHTLLGQNWDWVPFARGAVVLLHVERDPLPSFCTIVEAGMLAKVGMNEAGLGLCTNTLVSSRDAQHMGVPYHVMLRKLLDAHDVEEAAKLLGSVERALSANYLLADRSGKAANFETIAGGPSEIRVTRPAQGVLTHTNHFLDPEFATIDAYVANSPHSLTRLEDMRLGLASTTTASIPRLQEILRSHDHHPNGICGHPDGTANPLYSRTTVASFIADVTTRAFWFTDGPPCEGAYERIGLV